MGKTNADKVKDWRSRTKERIVKSMGGKCVCCGYNKCTASLTLHHLNPSEKEFEFGGIRRNPKSWKKIVNELRKCVLVCANCYAEIEHGNLNIPDNAIRFDESYVKYELHNSHLQE